MGKFFPDHATPEQTREYREKQKDQFRNSDYEHAANDYKPGEPSPWYDRYNTETNRAAEPLSPAQQRWNFQRALSEHDREQSRLQRASDRQDRERRRTERRQERTER